MQFFLLKRSYRDISYQNSLINNNEGTADLQSTKKIEKSWNYGNE